jgi:ribosomal protein S18 acetylase RimI-like enzyme
LIQELKQEAVRLRLPLVLRVEFFNPAVRLYQRLGFVKTREVNTVYQEMVWTPGSNEA